MRCEHCNQNEATTYIKQNINGKVTEMHLCRDCAEKLGVFGAHAQQYGPWLYV